MIDIVIIAIFMVSVSWAMKQHKTWTPLTNIGDFIGWFILSAVCISCVRFPIYLIWYGWSLPFSPSEKMQIVSGIVAILFWFSMTFWRIPKMLLAFVRR